MKRLFRKLDKIIPIKTYLIWFGFYFCMTGLLPLFYKITEASDETMATINAFNTYITIPTVILMLSITSIIAWIKYEVSKQDNQLND